MRIVHLSDIHLSKEGIYDTDYFIVKPLINDLQKYNSEEVIDFIFITGDLIDKGGESFFGISTALTEFENLFIQKLSTGLNIPKDNFFFCPGNHDIFPKVDEKSETDLTEKLSTIESVNEFVDSNNFKGVNRIFPYKQFEDNYYKDSPFDYNLTNFQSNFKILTKDLNIGITCFNSAWRCYDSKTDFKKILLGERQVTNSQLFLQKCDLKIGLIHHPLDWFTEFDRKSIMPMVTKEYDMFFCGHVHESSSWTSTNNYGNLFVSVAPTNWSSNTRTTDYTNGYSIIDLNEYSGEINVLYRKYSYNKGKYVPNTDLGDDKGIGEFNIPKKILQKKVFINATLDIDFDKKIHEIVLNKFLKVDFQKNFSDEVFNYYSELFTLVASSEKRDLLTKDLLNSIYEYIRTSSSPMPLKIEGSPGCGKTSFLSILYWYFYNKRQLDKTSVLPIYIDLTTYERKIYKDNISAKKQAIEALEEDLSPIENLIEKINTDFLFIIDGLDEYISFKYELKERINKLINNSKQNKFKKVIGVSLVGENPDEPTPQTIPETNLVFGDIKTKSNKLEFFVDKALKIYNKNIVNISVENIKDYLLKLKLKHVNIFTLFLMISKINILRNRQKPTLSEIYKAYCEEYLLNIGISSTKVHETLFQTSKIAYERFIENKNFSYEVLAPVGGLWQLVHSHINIKDYLVAFFIIEKLKNFSHDEIDSKSHVFEYLYSYSINRFCKEIINQNISTQQIILNVIKKVSSGQNTNLRGLAIYLAGRLDNNVLKSSAKEILITIKKNLDEKIFLTNDKEKLFFLRSLYISLIYLGDIESSNEYLKHLITKQKWEDMNRGFHLEYYEDIIIDPKYRSQADHSDTLGDCTKTFKHLYKNITDNFKNPQHGLFDVEFFTLCALVQHRQVNNDSTIENYREKVLKLIELYKNRPFTDPIIIKYTKMLKENLSSSFKYRNIIEKIYYLKSLKRSGWVNRKLDNCESVADHSFGSVLLALYFLPDNSPNPDYKKSEIIKMLLIHDIAEAYTGDIPNKTDKQREIEGEWIGYISMLGTYKGIANLSSVASLWDEFESTSHNGKVAKELDKLDNLTQLYIYKDEGKNITGFDEWVTELKNKVETNEGRHVLNIIVNAFEKGEELLSAALSLRNLKI